MDKHCVSISWAPLSNQKRTKCWYPHDNKDEFQMRYTECKKTVSKATRCTAPFMWNPGKGKTIGPVGTSMSRGAGMGRLWLQGGTGRFGGMIEPPHLDYGGGCMTVYMCQNSQNLTPKRVKSAICKLYLKKEGKEDKWDIWPSVRTIRNVPNDCLWGAQFDFWFFMMYLYYPLTLTYIWKYIF